ncbi:MAG: flavodoxin domain-containing protein [Actinomycetia bacterium]|nr:flavodoxin domain-containing protein [Actinomycetes bacterium]
MKAIIVYESEYGSTKKYAEWIAAELGCDSVDSKSADVKELANYQAIILGSCIHGGTVPVVELLKSYPVLLEDRKIALFAVGMPPYGSDYLAELQQSISEQVGADIPLFYMRGALDLAKMSQQHQEIFKMLEQKFSEKPLAERSGLEQSIIEACQKDGPSDWMSKEQIKPLLDWATA